MSLFHLEFFASHFLGPSHLFKVPLFLLTFLLPIFWFQSFSLGASFSIGVLCFPFLVPNHFPKMPVFFWAFFAYDFFSRHFFLRCQFFTWGSSFPVSWAHVIFLRCHFFWPFCCRFFGFSHFFSGAAFSLGVFFFLIVWVPVIFLRWHFSFLTFSLPTSAKKNICSAHLGTCHRKNVQKAQLFPFGGLSPEKFQFQIAKQKVG